MDPAPTRLDQVVGLLAKAVAALWVGGFGLLAVNAFVLDERSLYLIAVGAIRSGFVVALIILITILGTLAVRRIRARRT